MDTQIGGLIFPETYTCRFSCGNCSTSVGLRIPHGIEVYAYVQDHECPNCKCKLLQENTRKYTVIPPIYLPYGRGQW